MRSDEISIAALTRLAFSRSSGPCAVRAWRWVRERFGRVNRLLQLIGVSSAARHTSSHPSVTSERLELELGTI